MPDANEKNSKEERSMQLSSTPVKILKRINDINSVEIGSMEFPVKCSTAVAFGVDGEEEVLCGDQLCEKGEKSNTSQDSRLAASSGGLTTGVGPTEVDAMVRQGTCTGRVRMLFLYVLNCPREKS